MKMKFVSVILSLLFILTINNLSAQNSNTLLTIDNDQITVDEFMHIYEKNKGIGTNSDESLDDYLEKFVQFRLKVKEAKDLGMDTLTSFKEEFAGYRKQLAEPYFVDESIIEDLLKETIERKKIDLRAQHILFKVGENAMPADTLKAFQKALEVRKKLLAGEDFGELAKKYSDDPSAKDRKGQRGIIKGNEGNLGYFSSLDMVYPFENAAFNLKVGEISMPIRTVFGYHLIKLLDKSPASGDIKVAHLFLKMPSNASEKEKAAVKKTADSLYAALQNGAKYTDLVTKFSDDKGTIAKGGTLPEFTVNRMVPEFIEAIKKLSDSGDIAPPVLTSYGWHIIQLQHKTGTSHMDSTYIAGLEKKIRKDKRSQKSKSVIISEIKKEYGYKEYTKNLAIFYDIVDSAILTKKWEIPTNINLSKDLIKIGDKKISQGEFAQFLKENQAVKKDESFAEFVNRTFKDFSNKQCIAYEDARLEQKHPEFKLLVDEYRDGILLFDLMDKKVWSKANKDTTGLKEFYTKHKKDYLWGDRVKAQIYIIYKDSLAEPIYNAVKSGKSVEEIKNEFNKTAKSVVRIEEKLYSKGDKQIIDDTPWKVGLSKMLDYKGKKAFVNILEKVKPQPKKFKEARGLVVAGYQDYLKEEWERDLQKKYKVKFNKKVLKTLKNNLKK